MLREKVFDGSGKLPHEIKENTPAKFGSVLCLKSDSGFHDRGSLFFDSSQ